MAATPAGIQVTRPFSGFSVPVNFGEQILCDKPKSKLYTDLLPLIDSGAIDILENDKLLMQICGTATRRTRDRIDNAPGAGNRFKEPVFSAEQRAGDSRKIEEAHAQYTRSIV